MLQYEIKITGRVQGVGFRYFTHKKATELAIKGWVRNTRNGGVLVLAQGNKADLETFIDYLKIGPPMSRIDQISKVEMKIVNVFSDFVVKY